VDDEVILLLGSNAGRRVRRLREGIDRLSREVRIGRVSRIYAGEPVGRSNQAWFLNVAVRGKTALTPEGLLAFAKEVERSAGRKAGARWGPRELDVDILLMGGRLVREPHLEIPHPRLAERRFFLAPAAEVAPGDPVPPGGSTVAELLAGCRDMHEVFAL
jgi:2-amino-4-hydroxy-6-hydroxymethyldihydropteridine diphosphokinase